MQEEEVIVKKKDVLLDELEILSNQAAEDGQSRSKMSS
jgi:hypothetical protein